MVGKPAAAVTAKRILAGLWVAFSCQSAQVDASLPPEPSWKVWLVLMAGVLALAGAGAVWFRGWRSRIQRHMFREVCRLGEEILGLSTAAAIQAHLARVLPGLLRVENVQFYLYQRGSQTLEGVGVNPARSWLRFPVDAPVGVIPSGAAACFKNRTMLSIPDTAKSPFAVGAPAGDGAALPCSVLFAPMFARSELTGVFQVESRSRSREFSTDERVVVQHLANQVGLAVELQEQKTIREQLFRSEKLAAIGQFISGIVNELRAPLTSICRLSAAASEQGSEATGGEMSAILAEARRASQIVARLTSFAGAEEAVKPVDIQAVLRGLVEFRAQERKARGIAVRSLLDESPIVVLGSEGQLEKVLLDLLMQVEQNLSHASEKVITLRAHALAKRALIEVSFPRPPKPDSPGAPLLLDREPASLDLQVWRSVIAGHGGEVRVIDGEQADITVQIELPAAPDRDVADYTSSHSKHVRKKGLTTLLLEEDSSFAREFVALLGARGYRVVPVSSAAECLDLAQRVRFDLVFCSGLLRGSNWLDVYRRVSNRTGAFVLLEEGSVRGRASDAVQEGMFVLAKPVDQEGLRQTLDAAEEYLAGKGPAEETG